MKCFPMCVKLEGERVLLIGDGPQIRDKAEKLAPFGAVLRRESELTRALLSPPPAMVIIGDTPREQAERYSRLCRERGIAVNVVDMPGLCSFYFPALVHRGDVTVAVSTGGTRPADAKKIRQWLDEALPRE